MLSEFRLNPDDFYLLRVGYGGLMGAISTITEDGFGPSGFHAYPSTLEIDGYSGDYGPNFFGHAMNTGTYVTFHPEFGWLSFGGAIEEDENVITVYPRDTSRQRIYFAPLGVWLTLDSGKFRSISLDRSSGQLQVELDPASETTTIGRLRIEQPARSESVGSIVPAKVVKMERGAYVVPLAEYSLTAIRLQQE